MSVNHSVIGKLVSGKADEFLVVAYANLVLRIELK